MTICSWPASMSHVREAHDVEVELVVGDACGHDVDDADDADVDDAWAL